jgi:leucyl-tRNA synthetase
LFNTRLLIFYLDYGEVDWRKLTTENLDKVECYHDEVKKNFGATLDWLKEVGENMT